jgi:hypothetical protein
MLVIIHCFLILLSFRLNLLLLRGVNKYNNFSFPLHFLRSNLLFRMTQHQLKILFNKCVTSQFVLWGSPTDECSQRTRILIAAYSPDTDNPLSWAYHSGAAYPIEDNPRWSTPQQYSFITPSARAECFMFYQGLKMHVWETIEDDRWKAAKLREGINPHIIGDSPIQAAGGDAN